MSISIDNGAAYTTSTTVTLALGAPANATQMCFGNDGKSYGPWQAVAASTSYQLPSGDGDKTVYVQFADADGNVLDTGSATIVLDTQAPRGTFTIQEAPITTSTSVHLTLNATDANDVTYRLKNGADSDWTDWTSLTKGSDVSVPWTLTTGDGLKTVDLQFRDAAGNTATLTAQIQLETSAPGGGLWLTFKTPDYDGNKKESYFRIGAAKTTAEDALLASGAVSSNSEATGDILPGGHASAGWFEYTDGNRTIVTRGFHADSVGANRIESTEGDVLTYIAGEKVEYSTKSASVTAGDTHAFNWGVTTGLYGGLKYYITVGTGMSTTIGAGVTLSASVDLSATISHKIDLAFGTKVSCSTSELTQTKESTTKAKKSIHLRVKSDTDASWNKRTVSLAVAAGVGTAAALTSTIGLSALGETKKDDVAGAAATLAVGGAFSIAALISSVILMKKIKIQNLVDGVKKADTELKMTSDKIVASHNDHLGKPVSKVQIDRELMLTNFGGTKKSWISLTVGGDAFVFARNGAVVSGKVSASLSAGDGAIPTSARAGVTVHKNGNTVVDGAKADFFNGVLTVTK